MRVPGVGGPGRVIGAALAALEAAGYTMEAVSRVHGSAADGPSRRRYANAAAVIAGDDDPPTLLARLQHIERAFGRRRRGQRWRARPLDLDIVLWSGGVWISEGLTVPHPAFRMRSFVLGPAVAIAGDWRDPATGLTLRHLHARLTRPRRVPSCRGGRALSSVGRATDF